MEPTPVYYTKPEVGKEYRKEWCNIHNRFQKNDNMDQEKKPVASYFQTMKPIMYFLRLVGSFPCTFRDDVLEIRFCSFWTFYSVSIMSLQICYAIMSSHKAYISDRNQFDTKVFAGVNVIIVAFQASCPLPLCCRMSCVVTYFSKWSSFQEDLRGCGIKVETKLKRWVMLAVVYGIILSIATSYNQAMFHGGPMHIPGFILVNANILFSFFFWAFSVFFIRSSSSHLTEHLKEVASRRDTEAVAKCRNLWISLSDLTADLDNVFGPTLLGIIMLINTAVIVSSYGLVFSIRDYIVDGAYKEGGVIFGRAFFFLLTSSAIFVLCELGHSCTDAVGSQVLQELLRLKLSTEDVELQREVNLFTQTVSLRYPDMVLCGFLTLNRRLFVSLLSTGVTYLIVLVQFRSSESYDKIKNTSTSAVYTSASAAYTSTALPDDSDDENE